MPPQLQGTEIVMRSGYRSSEPECEAVVRLPEVGARVKLTVDIPDLGLQRNTAGVVCSQWFAPIPAYEVEFAGPSHKLRALLLGEHLCTATG